MLPKRRRVFQCEGRGVFQFVNCEYKEDDRVRYISCLKIIGEKGLKNRMGIHLRQRWCSSSPIACDRL